MIQCTALEIQQRQGTEKICLPPGSPHQFPDTYDQMACKLQSRKVLRRSEPDQERGFPASASILIFGYLVTRSDYLRNVDTHLTSFQWQRERYMLLRAEQGDVVYLWAKAKPQHATDLERPLYGPQHAAGRHDGGIAVAAVLPQCRLAIFVLCRLNPARVELLQVEHIVKLLQGFVAHARLQFDGEAWLPGIATGRLRLEVFRASCRTSPARCVPVLEIRACLRKLMTCVDISNAQIVDTSCRILHGSHLGLESLDFSYL